MRVSLYLFRCSVFFLFLLPSSLFAQEEKDSLWQLWKSEIVEDTLRLNALKQYTNKFELYNSPVKAYELYQEYLTLSKQIGDLKRTAYAYKLLGAASQINGDLENALRHYDDAVHINDSIGNEHNTYLAKINKAMVLEQMGNAKEALLIYEAFDSVSTANQRWDDLVFAKRSQLRTHKRSGNYKESIRLLGSLELLLSNPDVELHDNLKLEIIDATAELYKELNNNEKALEYVQKSIETNLKLNQITFAVVKSREFGEILLEQGDTLAAQEAFKSAYILSNQLKDSRLANLNAQYAMSVSKYLSKEYEQAELYTDSCLTMLKKGDLNIWYASVYEQLGKIKLEEKQLTQAAQLFEKSLKYARINGTLEEQKSSLYNLYIANKALGKNRQALAAIEEAKQIEDSLVNKEKIKAIAVQQAENKFSLERQETAFKHEAELKEEAHLRNNLLFGSLALVGIMSLIFLVNVNRRKRKAAQREQQLQENFSQELLQNTEDERSRIAGDLHDSVNHNLLTLKQKSQDGQMVTGKELEDVIQQVRSISYNLYPSMFEEVGLQKSIEELCRKVEEVSDLQIVTQMDYTRTLGVKQELQIYRIVEEALNNIMKHSEATHAMVKIASTSSELEVSVKDNGKGVSQEVLSGEKITFGMANMMQRAKSIHGKINLFSTEKGTELKLTVNS